MDHTKHEMEISRKIILLDPHVATDFIFEQLFFIGQPIICSQNPTIIFSLFLTVHFNKLLEIVQISIRNFAHIKQCKMLKVIKLLISLLLLV